MNEQRALPSAGGQPGIVVRFRWALAALLLAVGIGTGVAAALILGGDDDSSTAQSAAETEPDLEAQRQRDRNEQGVVDAHADLEYEACVGPATDDDQAVFCETLRQAILTNQTFDEWCELALRSLGVEPGSARSRAFFCVQYESWQDFFKAMSDWLGT